LSPRRSGRSRSSFSPRRWQSSPDARDPIFHIAQQHEWAAATTVYRPGGFDIEGFIHCSTASQVMKVVRRLFRGRQDLVLLRVDPDLLESEVRFENLEGGDELFPHIYGELDLEAVTGIEALAIGDDGEFAMPGLLIPARSMTRGEQLH
jgi:uncharacterized protein (DUF952 family)